MKHYTTEWVMTKQDLETAKIEWKIRETAIRDEGDRKSKELYYIHH